MREQNNVYISEGELKLADADWLRNGERWLVSVLTLDWSIPFEDRAMVFRCCLPKMRQNWSFCFQFNFVLTLTVLLIIFFVQILVSFPNSKTDNTTKLKIRYTRTNTEPKPFYQCFHFKTPDYYSKATIKLAKQIFDVGLFSDQSGILGTRCHLFHYTPAGAFTKFERIQIAGFMPSSSIRVSWSKFNFIQVSYFLIFDNRCKRFD